MSRERRLDPSTTYRFNMMADGEFREKLVRLRQAEGDLPNDADMMRRLVDRAIEQLDRKK